MLTDEELKAEIAKAPCPMITTDYIQSRISKIGYTVDGTLTICTIHIDNGFVVVGTSACVNAGNFKEEIGQKIAYDNAFKQLWPLYGFLLAEGNYLKGKQ